MAVVGRAYGSGLYWELKVAVPQIKDGRKEDRGGLVVGIMPGFGDEGSTDRLVQKDPESCSIRDLDTSIHETELVSWANRISPLLLQAVSHTVFDAPRTNIHLAP